MPKFAIIVHEPGYPKEPRVIAWTVNAKNRNAAEKKVLAHVGDQTDAEVEDIFSAKALPKPRARK